MTRHLAGAAAIVALHVAAVPALATPYPADPNEIGLDLPAVKGVCTAPCRVTATQPADGVGFYGEPGPFIYKSNGTWHALIWTGRLVEYPEDPGFPHREQVGQVLGRRVHRSLSPPPRLAAGPSD
jgi:hypothetical protein